MTGSDQVPQAMSSMEHMTATRAFRVRHERMHILFVFVAIVGILATTVASFFMAQYIKQSGYDVAQSTFESEAALMQNNIQDRLEEHLNSLYAVQGLFAASQEVTRDAWSAFVNELQFRRRYPGVTGMAYLKYIDSNDRVLFEQGIRKDISLRPQGYPSFSIHPTGQRDFYYPVKYIEPFDENVDLFGLDVATYTPAVLNRVRDTGELASLGRITLRDEQDYLFLLPIYQKSAHLAAVRDRRSALQGFVGAILRPQALIAKAQFLRDDLHAKVHLELRDSEGSILFQRSEPEGYIPQSDEDRLIVGLPVQVAGLRWTLNVSGPRTFGLTETQVKAPRFVLLSGLAFSMMLGALLYLVARSRIHALRLAGRMTSELGKFQLAVKCASNHIIITDTEGKIVYANPAIKKTTGYNPQEVIGHSPKLWGGKMNDEYYEDMWNTIKVEKLPYDGEITNRQKSGKEYEAAIHISPILDKDNNLFGFVGIEEDITQRKHLEQAKSDFVSLASHQLRTPLTAMRLTLETMLNGTMRDVNEQERELLTRAMEYLVHMTETIHTMLTISHFEAGKISVAHKELNVCDIFTKLQREYEPQFKRKEQQVVITCEENLSIHTDQKLLWEILSNLFSNAVKYTPEKGEVRLSAKQDGGYVRLEITDSGMGIPDDQKNRVFQKFFRGDNVVKKNTDGTGLGLYLVASLTTLLGGKISFVSQENQGTTFSLLLPLSPLQI